MPFPKACFEEHSCLDPRVDERSSPKAHLMDVLLPRPSSLSVTVFYIIIKRILRQDLHFNETAVFNVSSVPYAVNLQSKINLIK